LTPEGAPDPSFDSSVTASSPNPSNPTINPYTLVELSDGDYAEGGPSPMTAPAAMPSAPSSPSAPAAGWRASGAELTPIGAGGFARAEAPPTMVTGASFTATFSTPGTYAATVTATDDDHQPAQATETVTVSAVPATTTITPGTNTISFPTSVTTIAAPHGWGAEADGR
jgi:hypothetical protein